jgi:hypothetical protein
MALTTMRAGYSESSNTRLRHYGTRQPGPHATRIVAGSARWASPVGAENLCHQAILMNHASGT